MKIFHLTLDWAKSRGFPTWQSYLGWLALHRRRRLEKTSFLYSISEIGLFFLGPPDTSSLHPVRVVHWSVLNRTDARSPEDTVS